MKIKLIHDRYRMARGSESKLVYVICAKCKGKVLLYQKDGLGWLKRCYLNRIFWPKKYEALQHNKRIKDPEDMPKLLCLSCKLLVGVPVRHKDGRLAFRLIRGSFKRRTSKKLLEGKVYNNQLS